jgi:hypothetical protein
MTASISNLMTLCGASTGLIPRRMRAVKQYVTGQGTDRVLAPHTLTNMPCLLVTPLVAAWPHARVA